MKKVSVPALMFLSFCFIGVIHAQKGTREVLNTVNTATDCSEYGMAAVNGKLYLIGNDSEANAPFSMK